MNDNKRSILVVDDDKMILQVLKIILRSEGYSVETAETAQEAIEKSEHTLFHIALLDIKLPDMEGIELLKVLHKKFPEMVKIIITGYPTIENAAKALNHGAASFLTKPVTPENLLSLIKQKIEEPPKKTGGYFSAS